MEGTLTVTVTDPLKCEGSGIGEVGYITYRVNYTSDVPDFVGSGSVTRRYNDFCWLSEILNLTVSGCIIPSLPPKQTVGRFSADFVNGRRRGLEKFMQRLCLHPELRKMHSRKLCVYHKT
jgi:sorting nexin-1/2